MGHFGKDRVCTVRCSCFRCTCVRISVIGIFGPDLVKDVLIGKQMRQVFGGRQYSAQSDAARKQINARYLLMLEGRLRKVDYLCRSWAPPKHCRSFCSFLLEATFSRQRIGFCRSSVKGCRTTGTLPRVGLFRTCRMTNRLPSCDLFNNAPDVQKRWPVFVLCLMFSFRFTERPHAQVRF